MMVELGESRPWVIFFHSVLQYSGTNFSADQRCLTASFQPTVVQHVARSKNQSANVTLLNFFNTPIQKRLGMMIKWLKDSGLTVLVLLCYARSST